MDGAVNPKSSAPRQLTMDLYLLALLLGFIGLAVMAVSGLAGHGTDHGHADASGGLHGLSGLFGHFHGDADSGAHVHMDAGGHAGAVHGHADAGHAGGGHAGAHGHDVAHGHDAQGHDAAHGHNPTHGHGHDAGERSIGLLILSWLSPRVLFGVLVGIGAAGMLLRPHVAPVLTALLAVTAGVLFEVGVLNPVWGLLFRFASEPARTLVDAWMEVGTATTAFDAAGDGLVRIELNGEVRQILGRLRAEDRQAGVRVHMGDRVRVEEVDPTRNECVVAWLGPAEPAG